MKWRHFSMILYSCLQTRYQAKNTPATVTLQENAGVSVSRQTLYRKDTQRIFVVRKLSKLSGVPKIDRPRTAGRRERPWLDLMSPARQSKVPTPHTFSPSRQTPCYHIEQQPLLFLQAGLQTLSGNTCRLMRCEIMIDRR